MNFDRKINQKAKSKALAMIFSKKIKDNEFFVVDQITLNKGKTKEMSVIASLFAKDNFKKTNKALYLILPDADKGLIRFTRNLPYAFATTSTSINLVDLLNYKNIVILKDAISVLEKRLINTKK
jgi:large subunit ribosomal protein L4